jgi:hypothetical protein
MPGPLVARDLEHPGRPGQLKRHEPGHIPPCERRPLPPPSGFHPEPGACSLIPVSLHRRAAAQRPRARPSEGRLPPDRLLRLRRARCQPRPARTFASPAPTSAGPLPAVSKFPSACSAARRDS